MSHSADRPGVGVAVLIKRDNKILLSRRPNNPEQNHWQCAGGFLRAGENIVDCANRCALATGVQITGLEAGPYTNNVFGEQAAHTVTLYILARQSAGVPAQDWDWFDWQQLPQPLFLPLRLLLQHNRDWVAYCMNNETGN